MAIIDINHFEEPTTRRAEDLSMRQTYTAAQCKILRDSRGGKMLQITSTGSAERQVTGGRSQNMVIDKQVGEKLIRILIQYGIVDINAIDI